MPRILVLGASQFAGCFRELGFDVLTVVARGISQDPADLIIDFYSNPSSIRDLIRSEIESFSPDFIFQGDHSGPLIHAGLEDFAIPRVWYAIDTHLHLKWHRHYAALFDKVFCAQKRLVSELNFYQPDVEWLPLYCSGNAGFVQWEKREHDVSFVGKLDPAANSERVCLFEEIKRLGVPLFCTTGNFSPVYSSSKIVINQSVCDDLNLRFFEGAGCGALLITDELSHSMNEILEPQKDFLLYRHNNAQELASKIKWALSHDEEACEMAQRAFRKIRDSHMEINRARRVAQWFLEESSGSVPKEHGMVLSHLAWACDHCSLLDLPANLCEFFSNLAKDYALKARASESGRDRALLVLADRELRKNNLSAAKSLFMQINNIEKKDLEFQIRFSQLGAVTEAAAGNLEKASEIMDAILLLSPSDRELLDLNRVIKSALNRSRERK